MPIKTASPTPPKPPVLPKVPTPPTSPVPPKAKGVTPPGKAPAPPTGREGAAPKAAAGAYLRYNGPHAVGNVTGYGEFPTGGDAKFVDTLTAAAFTEPECIEEGWEASAEPFDGSGGPGPITATGATAGNPGSFTPVGATPPADLAAMTSGGIVASPLAAWAPTDYVVLGDASSATWDGAAWIAATGGVAATGATAGNPGSFTPAGATVPVDLAAMAAIVATPATAWLVGEHVVLGDASHASWDAAAWVVGDGVA